ncbi:MAG: PAS domain S-box protein [Desulfobacteraceae bacterium]|nr:MAG: PAS domain S-box protein [Desulfobacteraceae bacterium]
MRHKYLLGLLIAVVVGCLCLFQIVYSEVKEKTIAELNSRQLIHARQAAMGIEEYFSDLIIFLTKISESGHIISLDDQGRKEMDFALKTSRREIKAIARADESGRMLCSLPYEQTVIGRDISYQKHIREIMKIRKPVVSDVFTTMRGYNAIGLYVPVFKGKEYRGTLAFLIDFQAISRRFLQDIRIGETGYAWMISRDGIELYCPVPGHTGKSVFENCKEFPSIISMANEMVKGRQGVTTYTFNQIRDQKTETVRKQAVYLPVKVGDTFWSIVVASSEDEALATLLNFRNKLIFVAVLLLLVSAIISYYGMKAWGILREDAKRREAENALHESEERYKSLFENNHAVMLLIDPHNAAIIDANPAACAYYGWSREEIKKQRIDKINTLTSEEVKDEMQSARSEKRNHFFFKHRTADGTIRDVEVYSGPLTLKGKAILYSIVHDITERKLAEEALHESEERFRSMIQSLSDMIFILDRNGQLTYESPSASRILGYQPGYFIGKSPFIHIHHDDLDQVVNAMDEVVQSLNPGIPTPFRHLKSDGTWCYLEALGSNQFDNPRIQGIVLTVRDITERKLAEEALKFSFSLLSASLESTADGILIVDRQGKIARWNKKFADMWKIPEEVLFNRDDEKAINHILAQLADPEQFAAKVRKLYEQPGESSFDQIEFIDGRIFERYSQPQRIDDNIVGRVWSFRDITERKRAEEDKAKLEEQYRQAQKMEAIGQLAGGIAHDFNNMLNIILGYSQMALMKIEPSGPLNANIQEIMNAARRSADLVRQLLAFARKQTITPKALDLNDTVAGMLSWLRKLIGEDIDLLWMPSANLWPVKMDPAQIDQILANLAINARDSISGVGKITIETGKEEFDEAYCSLHADFIPGHYAMLAVSDNGCGMDKKTLDKIYEPFFTTKELGKGTGLGLATVYGIVRQNNGFINVYSEPGKGTKFSIYLSRSDGAETKVEEQPAKAGPLIGTETVLLVEDDEALLRMGEMMMKELGYTVLTAGSPNEAIQLAGQYAGDIQLLMTDVVMPEMSGHDLRKRFSTIRPDMECLFMSGYTENVIAHRGILNEGVHYLQKPFSMNDLASKVREALDKA